MVLRACGRSLYPGERYCIFGPRVIRFRQSWIGRVYPACPKRYQHLHLHIFVRDTTLAYRSITGWRDHPYLPNPKEYIYCKTTTTDLTPKQLFLALHHGDSYSLLGHNIREQDLLELDNGLTSDFLYLAPDHKWHMAFPEKGDLPDERVGGFQLLSHRGYDLDNFYEDSERAGSCRIGYLRGHFGPGRFVGQWIDGNGQQEKAITKELELLTESLTGSLLKSYEAMEDYCRGRFWAVLPKRSEPSAKEYGFEIFGKQAYYCLRCITNTDAVYQAYLSCYPVRD